MSATARPKATRAYAGGATTTRMAFSPGSMLAPVPPSARPHLAKKTRKRSRILPAGSSGGSAYVFVRAGGAWTLEQQLVASDKANEDRFGLTVSVRGDTAVVGAPFDAAPTLLSGSAYVFVRAGGVWTEQQKLTAGDGSTGDYFGYSVSVAGDTVLLGACNDDDKGDDSGSAYVFVRAGGVWTQQQKLTSVDGAAGDRFGWSASLQGDTALVGALGDDDKVQDSGAAYVFVRAGGVWAQHKKLTAVNAASGDAFAYSVALDGDTALVGAHLDDDQGPNSGAAYVLVGSGALWAQQQKLAFAAGAAQDELGSSVALDGNTALVGACQPGRPR